MEREQANRVLETNVKARSHQFVGLDYTAPLYFNKCGFLTLFYKDLNIIFQNGLGHADIDVAIKRLHSKWLLLNGEGWSLGARELNNNLSVRLMEIIVEKSYLILAQKTHSNPVVRFRTGFINLELNLVRQLKENRKKTGYKPTSLSEFSQWVKSQNDFKKFAWLKESNRTQNYKEFLKWKLEQKDYRSSEVVFYSGFTTKLSVINVPCFELQYEELILGCMIEFNKRHTKLNHFPATDATMHRKGTYGYG